MSSLPIRMVKLAHSVLLPKHLFAAIRRQQPPIRVAPILVESAALAPEIVYQRLSSRPTDLAADEAATRLVEHGPNVVAGDARRSIPLFLWHAAVNPLVLLLAKAMISVTATVRRDGQLQATPVSHLVHDAATAILAVAGAHTAVLRGAHATREEVAQPAAVGSAHGT